MKRPKQDFNYKDLLDLLKVNVKVVFAIILFIGVFFALFFGYYSLILIVISILFLAYSLYDALHDKGGSTQEETDQK